MVGQNGEVNFLRNTFGLTVPNLVRIIQPCIKEAFFMSNNSMKNLFLGSLRSKQTVIRIISLVLFVSVISFVLYQGTKQTVTLEANGEKKSK